MVEDTLLTLRRGFPDNAVCCGWADDGSTAIPLVYSQHLACLFPQHGPGPKHERPIRLEAWQRTLVAAAPYAFLRGLIHSDGCFFINRTGRYRYLSVAFSNRSAEIRELFVWACQLVGVASRPTGDSVRIYRRDSVQRLACFVGAKW